MARRLDRGPGANGTPLAFVHAYELEERTGTVAGALASGRRAAEEVISDIS